MIHELFEKAGIHAISVGNLDARKRCLGERMARNKQFLEVGKREACSSRSVFGPFVRGTMARYDQPSASGEAARFCTGPAPRLIQTPFTHRSGVPAPFSWLRMSI